MALAGRLLFPLIVVAALATGGMLLLSLAKQQGRLAGASEVRAELQPQLDLANRNVAILQAAREENEATILALQSNQAINEVLQDQYETQVAALTQQASDAASAIRKLQADDQTVAAYLSAHIPAGLRRLLNNDPGD